MKRVIVTQHAAERYVERVKPALTVSAAAVEVATLAELAGDPSEKPKWVANDERRGQVDAWLTICEGICLPLYHKRGRWIARTVLVRAGLSPERRESRRQKKQEAARKRRDRRTTRERRVGNRERWEDAA